MTALNLYNRDFFAWTQEQAELLHSKNFNSLDIEHIEEELRIMGASEKRELGSRLEVLLTHLLKWKYQPELQSRSWKLTMEEQRDKIKYHLEDNPSLKNQDNMDITLKRSYNGAILQSAKETGLAKKTFPQSCEWTIEQMLDNDFYPI